MRQLLSFSDRSTDGVHSSGNPLTRLAVTPLPLFLTGTRRKVIYFSSVLQEKNDTSSAISSIIFFFLSFFLLHPLSHDCRIFEVISPPYLPSLIRRSSHLLTEASVTAVLLRSKQRATRAVTFDVRRGTAFASVVSSHDHQRHRSRNFGTRIVPKIGGLMTTSMRLVGLPRLVGENVAFCTTSYVRICLERDYPYDGQKCYVLKGDKAMRKEPHLPEDTCEGKLDTWS